MAWSNSENPQYVYWSTLSAKTHWCTVIDESAALNANTHYDSIFGLPSAATARIHAVAQRVAVAMTSVYRCEGVSTRQHNGPGGGQEIWHYHLHVLPRWRNDRLYERTAERFRAPPDERARRAGMLRAVLDTDLG